MTTRKGSRRDFLQLGGTVASTSWIALNIPLILSASEKAQSSMADDAAFQHISTLQAAQLKSIVDQIIPADDTPSASEIGVVHFIDQALGGFMEAAAPMLAAGLVDLENRSVASFPESVGFSQLTFEQQTTVLESIEDTEFFVALQFLTNCGMFCMPVYGGNRDHAGWDLLGFSHQHAWQPPFGHYDAAIHAAAGAEEDSNEHG